MHWVVVDRAAIRASVTRNPTPSKGLRISERETRLGLDRRNLGNVGKEMLISVIWRNLPGGDIGSAQKCTGKDDHIAR